MKQVDYVLVMGKNVKCYNRYFILECTANVANYSQYIIKTKCWETISNGWLICAVLIGSRLECRLRRTSMLHLGTSLGSSATPLCHVTMNISSTIQRRMSRVNNFKEVHQFMYNHQPGNGHEGQKAPNLYPFSSTNH